MRLCKRMRIEIIESPEGPKVSQSFDFPSVYLDHWAICQFSDERALQDRFVTALPVHVSDVRDLRS
jgi:hypothetical protein